MRRALILLAVAAGWLLVCGWWLASAEHVPFGTGAYWALASAATVGYLTPDRAGLLPMTVLMLTGIPLLLAVFGLATSAHIRKHHQAGLDAMEKRLADQAAAHHEAHMDALRKDQ